MILGIKLMSLSGIGASAWKQAPYLPIKDDIESATWRIIR